MRAGSEKVFIEQAIDLDVPPGVAYGECREIEQFPLFLPEVLRVEAMSEWKYRWVAEYGGESVARAIEIESVEPERRIGWRAHGVPEYFGTVEFEPLDTEQCRLIVRVHREGLGPPSQRPAEHKAWEEHLASALRRFKEFVEAKRVTHEPVFAGMAPARPGRFPEDLGPRAHLEEAAAPPEHEIGLPKEDEPPGAPPGPEEF